MIVPIDPTGAAASTVTSTQLAKLVPHPLPAVTQTEPEALPKVIVTLGNDAYYKVMGEHENFENVRGHVIDCKKYKLIPMFHKLLPPD